LEALEQWNDFQNTFTNELHDADMGRVYFMDMQLTRSLSILPEDLTEFVQETTDWHRLMSDEELEQQQEKVIIPFQAEQEPLLSPTPSCEEIFTGEEEEEEEEEGKMISSWDVSMGYVMLFVAVLAISSNGTALHLLYGVPPALKLFWRMTATTLLLSFFVIKGVFWNGYTGPNMGHHEWMTFAMAVITFAAHTLLLYTAFEYTTIGNAVIYGNSQALLLIIGRAFLGHSVSGLEILGVIVAFTGAILCSRDSEQRADVEIDYDPRMAMLGDGLALLSSVAGVAYLTCAKAVRPHISVTLFMFLVMFFGSVCIFIYLILTGVPITWSRDPHTGLLGWFTMENNHFLIMLHSTSSRKKICLCVFECKRERVQFLLVTTG
jgi:drug/metabolite transporter (DMT)-like permease